MFSYPCPRWVCEQYIWATFQAPGSFEHVMCRDIFFFKQTPLPELPSSRFSREIFINGSLPSPLTAYLGKFWAAGTFRSICRQRGPMALSYHNEVMGK